MGNNKNLDVLLSLGEKIHEYRELKKMTRKIGDDLSTKKNEEPPTYRLVDVGNGMKLRLREEEITLSQSNLEQVPQRKRR